MSLTLSYSNPVVNCKTFGIGDLKNNVMINIEDESKAESLEIEEDDFCELIFYFFTNTDLMGEEDPRIKLMEEIKKLEIGEGWNEGDSKRFKIK